MKNFLTKKAFWGLSFAVVLSVMHGVFFVSSWGQRFEFFFLDFLFRLRGVQAPDPSVLLVSIDEASYQNLGVAFDQAWPRRLHAALLEKLRQAGARRVAFDVLFLGSGEAESDEKLAKAFALLPTVIGADMGSSQSGQGELTELLYPEDKFAAAVSEVALVGLPETYGSVRQFRLEAGDSEIWQGMRPLASAAAGNLAQSGSMGPRDLIDYYGPAGSIEHYSYYQVLEEEVPFPLEKFKDKTVFVGLQLRSETGPEQKDSYLTSFNQRGRTFGVEIHATIASNLIKGEWVRRLSLGKELMLLTWLVITMSIVAFNLRPLRAGLVLAGCVVLWLGGSSVAFAYSYFLPGLSAVAIFAPFIYLTSSVGSYVLARRSQLHLRRAFKLYLSPHMAREVSQNPDSLKLGGEKVVATAFFTDIADFTPLSESMEAEKVTHMLNDYFTELVEAIFEQQGTLIKFIGDAVFALWGVPLKLENHQDAALKAALLMRDRLGKSPVLQKYPKLVTRIGIHSGPMVVGNLGSHKRFDFTAIGDSVNLASRVEGLNKYLGTTLLLTGETVNALKESYNLVSIGKVRVWGKQEAVSLFTILEGAEKSVNIERWQRGIEAFQCRDWHAANESFIACIESAELSQAAKFYLEQTEEFRLHPPGEQWHGELVFHSK